MINFICDLAVCLVLFSRSLSPTYLQLSRCRNMFGLFTSSYAVVFFKINRTSRRKHCSVLKMEKCCFASGEWAMPEGSKCLYAQMIYLKFQRHYSSTRHTWEKQRAFYRNGILLMIRIIINEHFCVKISISN